MTIYDAVDFFERSLFVTVPRRREQVTGRVRLREILNLHNVDGMRDVPQIRGMISQIRAGGDVLHATGLPNVKIVASRRGEWVLFDGHHTTVAYMATGRRYLDEIPHLIVREGPDPVKDSGILVFFGSHSKRLTPSTWRNYVINWQAPPEGQLCARIESTMCGLFESLAGRHSFLSPPAVPLPA
ncbi:MAG: hypothetical protein JSU61_11350 [Fidelibacterota bacterium]|nr:MAG: hypothetical protein JSU61_11350 [Candidatus Neomarinimicrobiota bacterium]